MNHDLDAAVEQMRQLVIIVVRTEAIHPVSKATHLSLWLSLGAMSGILGVPYQDIIPRSKARKVPFFEQLASLFKKKVKEDEDEILMDLWRKGQASMTVLVHLAKALNPERIDDFLTARRVVKDYLDLAAFSL